MIFAYYPKIMQPALLGSLATVEGIDPLAAFLDTASQPVNSSVLAPSLDKLLSGAKYHKVESDEEFSELVDMGTTGFFVAPVDMEGFTVSDELKMSSGDEVPADMVPWVEDGLWNGTIEHTADGVTQEHHVLYHPFVPDSQISFVTKGQSYYRFDGTYRRNALKSIDSWIKRKYVGIDLETGLHLFETRIRCSNMIVRSTSQGGPPDQVTYDAVGGIPAPDGSVDYVERVVVNGYHMLGVLFGQDEHFLYSMTGIRHLENDLIQNSPTAWATNVNLKTISLLGATHFRPFKMQDYLDLHFETWRERIDAGLLPAAVWAITSHDDRRARALEGSGKLNTHIAKSYFFGRGTGVRTEDHVSNSIYFRRNEPWFLCGNEYADCAYDGYSLTSTPNVRATEDKESWSTYSSYLVVECGPFGSTTTLLARNNGSAYPAIRFQAPVTTSTLNNLAHDLPQTDFGGGEVTLIGGVYGPDIDYPAYVGTEYEKSSNWKYHGVVASVSIPLPDQNAPGSTNEEIAAREATIVASQDAADEWLRAVEAVPPSITMQRERARYHYGFPLLG